MDAIITDDNRLAAAVLDTAETADKDCEVAVVFRLLDDGTEELKRLVIVATVDCAWRVVLVMETLTGCPEGKLITCGDASRVGDEPERPPIDRSLGTSVVVLYGVVADSLLNCGWGASLYVVLEAWNRDVLAAPGTQAELDEGTCVTVADRLLTRLDEPLYVGTTGATVCRKGKAPDTTGMGRWILTDETTPIDVFCNLVTEELIALGRGTKMDEALEIPIGYRPLAAADPMEAFPVSVA